MPNLVTLDELKLHLRYDTDAMDADLSLKLLGAQSLITHYCQGTDLDTLTPEDTALIKAAILQQVGVMDRVRAGEEDGAKDPGFWLSPSVRALLLPFRTPSAV